MILVVLVSEFPILWLAIFSVAFLDINRIKEIWNSWNYDIEKIPGAKILPSDRVYDYKLIAFHVVKSDYMKSQMWDGKRTTRLRMDNYTCQGCGTTTEALEVHHLRGYDLLPAEPLDCLTSLCRSCHEIQHTLNGKLKTYEDFMSWDTKLIKVENQQ